MNKRHGFIAFIDESGQEGGDHNAGASEFFVISAVICRTDKTVTPLPSAFSRAAKRLGHGPEWRPRKFSSNSNPGIKYVVADELGAAALRHVSIIAHKPTFNSPAMTERHGKMYFFVSQLLLERISWACRDAHRLRPSGNGKAAILFSHRTTLSYDAFRRYAEEIRDGHSKYESFAAWDHLDLKAIRARPHSKHCDGLLAADWVASSFGCALERKPNTGLTDDRFVRRLRRNVYRYDKKSWTNGVKLFPPEAEHLIDDDERFWWFRAFFDRM